MPRISFSGFHTRLHPETQPGDGASSRGHGEKTPTVVSGGNHFPASPSPSIFRGKPISSHLQSIDVKGEPGPVWIKDPDRAGPHELYTRDPQTDAPLPTGKYAQADDRGQWIASDASGRPLAPKTGQEQTPHANDLPSSHDLSRYALPDSATAGMKPDARGIYAGADHRFYLRLNDAGGQERVYEIRSDFKQDGPVNIIDPATRKAVATVSRNVHGQWQRQELKGGMDDQRPGSSRQSEASGSQGTIMPHNPHLVRVYDAGPDNQGRQLWRPVEDVAYQETAGIKPGKGWVTPGRYGLEPYTPKPGERPAREILVDTKDSQGNVKTEWKYLHGTLASDDRGGAS